MLSRDNSATLRGLQVSQELQEITKNIEIAGIPAFAGRFASLVCVMVVFVAVYGKLHLVHSVLP